MTASRIKLFLCSVLIIAISSSFTSGSDMVFRVKDGEIYINNKMIKSKWPYKGFKSILGSQDRTQSNRVEIYDSYGILLYRHLKHKKNITEIQVRFSNHDNSEITTNQAFPGTVLVDDFTVTKNLSPSKVENGLSSDWHKVSCSLEHEIKMLYNHTYIYFKFNEEENELSMIAIGRDND